MELTTWSNDLLNDMQQAALSALNNTNFEIIECVNFPLTDIIQTTSGYRLYADIPGMVAEQIDLKIDDGVMTLSGDRVIEYEDQQAETPVLNRPRGKFSISFNLSDKINYHRVTAVVKDGVLKVDMPVSDHSHPNQINVPIRQSKK